MYPPIRVRFAPSPTGGLHLGGARTALYTYFYAKRHEGTFILRIEDTDKERSSEVHLREQLADLQWLGLDWDEGLDPETLKDRGSKGPYCQSQRKEIYQKYADQLLSSGQAYYCFLTDSEVENQRKQAQKKGLPPQIDSPYRNWSLKEARQRQQSEGGGVVRFKTSDFKKDYHLKDMVRGDVHFPSNMVGDFILLRSTGVPVYNFCCVIDDHLMQISHVFRGEEHLSNSLRQMMIYETLGWTPPRFGHLSIILGEDRQKLSKRHGAISVGSYREEGFLPEAMNNFLALLGWSSPDGQEVMSVKEIISQFDEDRLHSAAAVFDKDKLMWFNTTHLRALPDEELWNRLSYFFAKKNLTFPDNPHWRTLALDVMKTSIKTLDQASELFRPLSQRPLEFHSEALEVFSWEPTKKVIQVWKSLLEAASFEFMDPYQFEQIQKQIKKDCSVKGKHLFMPLRTAIVGQPHGAELKVLVPLLDRLTLLQRANQALKFIREKQSVS